MHIVFVFGQHFAQKQRLKKKEMLFERLSRTLLPLDPEGTSEVRGRQQLSKGVV